MSNLDFGRCECGGEIEPIWFKEKETDRVGYRTGRVRDNIDVLVCQRCLKEFCIDDSYAGPWHYEKTF